jgi:hypothetical protein
MRGVTTILEARALMRGVEEEKRPMDMEFDAVSLVRDRVGSIHEGPDVPPK